MPTQARALPLSYLLFQISQDSNLEQPRVAGGRSTVELEIYPGLAPVFYFVEELGPTE